MQRQYLAQIRVGAKLRPHSYFHHSRCETCQIAWKEGRQTHIGSARQLHDEALHTYCKAAMRGHPIAKRLEILAKWFWRLPDSREGHKVLLVAVQALAAGDQLDTAKEEVKGVGILGPL